MERTNKIKIENYIPKGSIFAVERQELERLTGLPDRENRRLIVEAIERGVPIVNVGCGYFICDGETEDFIAAQNYIRTELARHKKIVKHIHDLEKALKTTYQEDSIL